MRTRAGGSGIDPRSFDGAVSALVEDLRRRYYSVSLQGHVADALARFLGHLREMRIHDLRLVCEEHVTAYALEAPDVSAGRSEP